MKNQQMSEDYLKEHKIKGVALITEGTRAPHFVVDMLDGHSVSVVVSQGMDIYDAESQAVKEVEDYEWIRTCKNRKRKLDKLSNKMKE